MGTWLDRYRLAPGPQVWTEMTALGADIRNDAEWLSDATAVARETMRRARRNVELLVELLPSIGYEFNDEPFTPPPANVTGLLDEIEATIGVMPLALRVFFEEVGQVNLVGGHPGWDFDYLDQLVVEAPVDFILSEFEDWDHDRGTDWDRGSLFELPIAPDYLHKADVSGGAPYSVAVPNPGADGLLLWEPHMTTFSNYLRIAYRMGGMPGWQREPALLDEWALPDAPPPPELVEVARRLLAL
jgi:hypothetical protein